MEIGDMSYSSHGSATSCSCFTGRITLNAPRRMREWRGRLRGNNFSVERDVQDTLSGLKPDFRERSQIEIPRLLKPVDERKKSEPKHTETASALRYIETKFSAVNAGALSESKEIDLVFVVSYKN